MTQDASTKVDWNDFGKRASPGLLGTAVGMLVSTFVSPEDTFGRRLLALLLALGSMFAFAGLSMKIPSKFLRAWGPLVSGILALVIMAGALIYTPSKVHRRTTSSLQGYSGELKIEDDGSMLLLDTKTIAGTGRCSADRSDPKFLNCTQIRLNSGNIIEITNKTLEQILSAIEDANKSP